MTASNLSPTARSLTARPLMARPRAPPQVTTQVSPQATTQVSPQVTPQATPQALPVVVNPIKNDFTAEISLLMNEMKYSSVQYQIGIERAAQEGRFIAAAWLQGIWRENRDEQSQAEFKQWYAYTKSPSHVQWASFVNNGSI
jgi:hypothetical protein